MTGESGEDPWELDPFGSSEYEPNAAFAQHAARQAERLLQQTEAFVARELHDCAEATNQIVRTARKSMQAHLDSIRLLNADCQRLAEEALNDESQAASAIEALSEAQRLDQIIQRVANGAHNSDPTLYRPVQPPVDPDDLVDPHQGSTEVLTHLRSFLNRTIGNKRGDLVVVKATPGVGKTHGMIETAYQEHRNGRRVVFAARTKEMIRRDDGELAQRVVKRAPMGRISLAVIHGRDESNCFKHEAVEAVMAHGYSPFVAVCRGCEHYPDNAKVYGLNVCGYYDERLTADMIAKSARRRHVTEYPFVLTTHASVVAATNMSGSSKYGSFWPYDVCYFDEDPTDALEVDVPLTEAHASFRSNNPRTLAAGVAAAVYRTAIDIAKEERSIAQEGNFAAPGSDEINSHPIHTKYDSCYAAQDLWKLLEKAREKVALTQQVESLALLLRNVSDSSGFTIDAGTLSDVDDAEDINALGIPPKTLQQLSGAIHEEANHALRLRRELFTETHGMSPRQMDPATPVMDVLQEHTDLGPMSYRVRLECVPADGMKGRPRDEWRFVLREARSFDNRSSTLVIGDGYAQFEHYEELFDRTVQKVEVTSELNPDAEILRVLDEQKFTITYLERAGIYEALKMVEAQMDESVREGERVLVYVHMALKARVDEWLQGFAERKGLRNWAVEHWWGGRGKDQYGAWEHTFCISDPIQSLSGIAHVANARAWRDSRKAKALDEKLKHATRCEIGDGRKGAISALRGGHPRIEREHERMNVSELTQAMHRSRPVHHPSNIYVYGGMEQSQDLVAQTRTFLPTEAPSFALPNDRKDTSGKRRARQRIITDSAFVTSAEAEAAIRAIIAHYGVYSAWFAHALQVVPDRCVSATGEERSLAWLPAVTGGYETAPNVPSRVQNVPNGHSKKISKSAYSFENFRAKLYVSRGAVFKTNSLTPRRLGPITSADSTGFAPPADLLVHRAAIASDAPRQPALAARAVATEPVLPSSWRPLPNPRSIIERVWHPGPHWDVQVEMRYAPHGIYDAHQRILNEAGNQAGHLARVEVKRKPKWSGFSNGGTLPELVYDTRLLGNFANALQVYQTIIDRQYATIIRDGHLVRPKAVLEVPSSLSDVPF